MTQKVYKFVGVNVTHMDFIKRYSRLGPREYTTAERLEGEEMQAMTCEKLATVLLLTRSRDVNARSKYEVGKTKIFIRCVEEERYLEFRRSLTLCVSSICVCVCLYVFLQRCCKRTPCV